MKKNVTERFYIFRQKMELLRMTICYETNMKIAEFI